MRIDLNPEGGGVLIEGTEDELHDFAETIADAAEDGEASGAVLTSEAVEVLTIRRVGESA